MTMGFTDPWKKHALRIIYYIARFLIILKTQTHSYKFKLINFQIFNILDDVSSDYNYYFMKNFFKQKPNRIAKLAYKFQLLYENYI
jgi:hypothetical protein